MPVEGKRAVFDLHLIFIQTAHQTLAAKNNSGGGFTQTSQNCAFLSCTCTVLQKKKKTKTFVHECDQQHSDACFTSLQYNVAWVLCQMLALHIILSFLLPMSEMRALSS